MFDHKAVTRDSPDGSYWQILEGKEYFWVYGDEGILK